MAEPGGARCPKQKLLKSTSPVSDNVSHLVNEMKRVLEIPSPRDSIGC